MRLVPGDGGGGSRAATSPTAYMTITAPDLNGREARAAHGPGQAGHRLYGV